jgi:hypothetical protein
MAVPLNARQLLVLDSRMAGWQALMLGARPGVAALVLDPTRDGIAQIIGALDETGPVSVVHIVDSAPGGRLRLGATELEAGSLGLHGPALAVLGSRLAAGGALLFWSRRIGGGAAGAGFLGRLARAVGRDVAAVGEQGVSEGHPADWALEVAAGDTGLAPSDAVLPAALLRFEGALAQGRCAVPAWGAPRAAAGASWAMA